MGRDGAWAAQSKDTYTHQVTGQDKFPGVRLAKGVGDRRQMGKGESAAKYRRCICQALETVAPSGNPVAGAHREEGGKTRIEAGKVPSQRLCKVFWVFSFCFSVTVDMKTL